MQKFKPINNDQIFLLPPSINEFIDDNHLAKLVSEVVDNLDTKAIESKYSELGQKSYHPKLLLKILFYGYAIGIRSGRKIAAACDSDLAFMYLSCMYHPDFRTINDFRKNNIEAVEQLLVEVLKICYSLNMVNIGTLIIDSTKLRANASSRRTKTHQQYQTWLTELEQQVKGVLKEADIADEQEDAAYGESKRGDELPSSINSKEKLKNKIKEVMSKMNEEEKKNLTDNDAKMIMNKGSLSASYNCQASVTTNGIIVSAYATNAASDKEHLLPVIEQAQTNTSQKVVNILADSGYASYDNYELLNNLGKTILVPDQEINREATTAMNNPFHRTHFIYDNTKDEYTCPANKPLTLYDAHYVHMSYKQKGKVYRGIECSSCISKSQCTKGAARQLIIEDRMPLRDTIRKLLDSTDGRALYKLRQQTIEPIFGNLKHNLKYTMMHLRTLKKVNAEWLLICLTHNIKQIWKTKIQFS